MVPHRLLFRRFHRRAGLGGGLLDEFADDVTDAQQAAAGAGGGGASLTGLFGRQRLSQKFGADITAQLRAGRGGDDDLPAREPLYERRAKYDAVAARKAAAAGGGDDEDMEDEYDYEVGVRVFLRAQMPSMSLSGAVKGCRADTFINTHPYTQHALD